VIDLHSHILPGVDDGAGTLEDAIEIARSAVADGIEVIAATPHVRDDHPTTPEAMEQGVGELRRALAQAGVELDVRKGGEISFEWLARLPPHDLRRFGLGGNPGYLLVEYPYYGWPIGFDQQLFLLKAAGCTPVLAHPERNGDVIASPERLRPLVDGGALVQVTAASLDGRLGRGPRDCGLELIDAGLAQLLASDAHHASIREIGMSAAAEAIGDETLARWLTVEVPGAIIAGRPLPERPAKRRRGWLRRG